MRAQDAILSVLLIIAVMAAFSAAIFVFSDRSALDAHRQASTSAPALVYTNVSFDDLPGWPDDDQFAALEAFRRSCAAITAADPNAPANPYETLGEPLGGGSFSGLNEDWRTPCVAAESLDPSDFADQGALTGAAREFFETHFTPVQLFLKIDPPPERIAFRSRAKEQTSGLFTGYFEPEYTASQVRTPEYSAPVRMRPGDLISVDLAQFREGLAGQRIAGRVENGRLAPYPDRAAIDAGALGDAATPIAWLRANDLFFLQIQGSGVLRFADGDRLRVGYDGQNGHQYTAIGRLLVERGAMDLETVSMQSIREWLEQAPAEDARALREANASYVFFKPLIGLPDPALGPLGAQQVQLTPGRSLAVDRRYHAMGAPLWIDLDLPADGAPAPRRLMIAQDAGGAIKGPIRGDIFWGAGEDAGEIAGAMRAEGRLYVLVPKTVAARHLQARAP